MPDVGLPAATPLRRCADGDAKGLGTNALARGLALFRQGCLEDAVAPLTLAAEHLPLAAEAPTRLGAIAGLRGLTHEAAAHFRAALAREADHLPALAALATLEAAAGRPAAAATLLDRAAALDPHEPEIALARARLDIAGGRAADALTAATAVLARHPGHAGAAQLFSEAASLALGPDGALAEVAARANGQPFAAGWPLAAAVLHGTAGRADAALAELRTAAVLAPGDPEIAGRLGSALADACRPQEAEPLLRTAIAARPTDVALRNRLATVLWARNRPGGMRQLLEAAIGDFGPQPTLLMNLALARNACGDGVGARVVADAAVAAGGGRDALVNRIAVLPYQADAAALLTAARAIAENLGPPPTPLAPAAKGADRRLRVGLLSGGLGQHPVGWLTVAGIEALPSVAFEVAAYALRPRTDALANRFHARADLWRDVAGLDDAAIAARIAADRVDILIELGGYGEGGRPFVLHHRPAPVQIKWVGAQFGTLGLDTCDWMLTDARETPPGSERHYTERLLRLPDGYVCYAPPGYAPPVGALPAAANGHVTFGCFNNLAKITPAVLDTWAAILAALPTARLVLRTHALSEDDTAGDFRARMIAAGLPAARAHLGGGLSHHELLAAYGGIDIALDPFPYTGGLTVCEALWMGVPTLTLAGDSFCARHALSHLGNVGLGDWVTTDRPGYVTQAIERTRDLPTLAALRAGLRARVAASPLCDAPRFGRALGDALRFAWRDACARGRPPADA